MSAGYLNRNEGYGCVNRASDQFPQIAGAAGNSVAPQIGLDQFEDGVQRRSSARAVTTRPTFIVNDAVTWVKGAHTLKAGMEWRKIMGNLHSTATRPAPSSSGEDQRASLA